MNAINTTTVPRGILELARPNLETLAHEYETGRGLRIATVVRVLERNLDMDDPYDVRAIVAECFGDEVADADDDPDMCGIPAIEAFIALRDAYGDEWARLAYQDYLTHYAETHGEEPASAASSAFNRSMEEYFARKTALRKVA